MRGGFAGRSRSIGEGGAPSAHSSYRPRVAAPGWAITGVGTVGGENETARWGAGRFGEEGDAVMWVESNVEASWPCCV